MSTKSGLFLQVKVARLRDHILLSQFSLAHLRVVVAPRHLASPATRESGKKEKKIKLSFSPTLFQAPESIRKDRAKEVKKS